MEELSQKEIDEREATLRRLVALLSRQREKFREYLAVLDKQSESIDDDDCESILARAQTADSIARDIEGLEKTIEPLRSLRALQRPSDADDSPAAIEEGALERLRKKAMARNKSNRARLEIRMAQMKEELRSFQNPYKSARSVYARKESVGNLVEVNA